MASTGIALDDIAEIDDFSDRTLLEVADRLERSTTFQEYIAREIELDEVFRRVETGIKAMAGEASRHDERATLEVVVGLVVRRRPASPVSPSPGTAGLRPQSVGYSSAISVYTRGFLQHGYGVDLTRLQWLVNSGPFPVHNTSITIRTASSPPRSSIQRLLDGEIDASTGDITDLQAWRALEAPGAQVKRLFADYQAENFKLLRDHGIFTPVHIIVIGGRLDRERPEVARTLYNAFERSRHVAYEDALSDATGYSIKMSMRELLRDEVADLGEVYTHGIAANARAIDAFLDFCHEQGVTKTRLKNGEVSARGTLET
jgi:4,5-dihydroxyphthalate decarboxylase